MARADSRTRLREFQEELAGRLARARLTPATASRLGFSVSDTRWVLELGEAGEIVPISDISPVPLTYPWYRGLTNIRGNLVSVIDLSVFLGGPPTRVERDSRVLSFAPSLDFNAGLLVTRMLGLHDASTWQGGTADSSAPAWAAKTLNDGQFDWREINLRTLAADDRFLKISPL